MTTEARAWPRVAVLWLLLSLFALRVLGQLLVVAGLLKPEMKVEIEVTAKRRTA